MKRWALAALVVVVVAVGVWLWWPAGEPDAAEPVSAGDAAGATAPEAPRAAAILNAVMNAPLPPAKGTLSIRGKVLGPSGPVAGAAVTATVARSEDTLSAMPCRCDNKCGRMLLECGCGDAARQMVDLVAERRGEAQPVARAVSGADGTYELSGFEEASTVTLWAERNGAGIGVRTDVRAGDEGADITLDEAMEITVQVSDEDGKAVGGALVTAVYSLHSRFFDGLTAEDGSVRLAVPRGEFRLVISADGFLPGNDSASERERRVEVELARPRRLAGKVTRGGDPVKGAKVQAYGEHRRLSTQTDGAGAFVIRGLRPGSYQVTAREGALGAELKVALKSDLDDVVLSLDMLSVFVGEVRDSSGRPVATAEVRVSRTREFRADPITRPADSAGRFRVEVSGAGEYDLAFSAKGFVSVRSTRTILAGATERVDASLQQSATLTGSVVDALGAPIAKARVRAQPDFEETAPGQTAYSQSASTDGDGGFDVDGLSAGKYRVTVTHEYFLESTREATVPTRGLRVVLAAGAEISGTVVDGEESPQRGVAVSVRPEGGGDYGAFTGRAVTDAQGRFTMKAAPEGRFVATAIQELEGDSRIASVAFAIEKTTVPPVRLRFQGTLSITGQVRTKSGRPVARADVILVKGSAAEPGGVDLTGVFRSKLPASWAKTQEDGAFTLRYLEAGSYRLSASKEGHAAGKEQVFVTAGQSGIVLTLDPHGSLKGRVLDDRGRPMAKYELDGDTIADPKGAFEIPVRSTREMQLEFKADGFAPAYRTAKAVLGEVVLLPDVVLTRGRTLRGRVVDAASGAPVAGALVDSGGMKYQSVAQLYLSTGTGAVESQPDGAFTLPNVAEGQVLVVAQERAHRELRTVVEAGQNEVVLKLERGAAVVGTVLGPGGSVPKAIVYARTQKSGESSEVKPDGTYEVGGLAPGTYTVSVQVLTGGRYLPRQVEVPASGAVRVDFAAPKAPATLRVAVIPAPSPGLLTAMLMPGDIPVPSSFKDWVAGEGGIRGERQGLGYVFRGLPAGRYSLFLMTYRPDGWAVFRQGVDLVAGEQQLQVKVPANVPVLKLDLGESEEPGD